MLNRFRLCDGTGAPRQHVQSSEGLEYACFGTDHALHYRLVARPFKLSPAVHSREMVTIVLNQPEKCQLASAQARLAFSAPS